eukprot:Hpha_TRINITY_DN15272_c0_g2::TRINITY_DN15272_c0_g2_i1::g.67295::m.67295
MGEERTKADIALAEARASAGTPEEKAAVAALADRVQKSGDQHTIALVAMHARALRLRESLRRRARAGHPPGPIASPATLGDAAPAPKGSIAARVPSGLGRRMSSSHLALGGPTPADTSAPAPAEQAPPHGANKGGPLSPLALQALLQPGGAAPGGAVAASSVPPSELEVWDDL